MPNESGKKERSYALIVVYGGVCLLTGLYFGRQINPKQSLDRAYLESAKLLSRFPVGPSNATGSTIANSQKIPTFPGLAELREFHIKVREVNAEESGKRLAENGRDEYWEKLRQLGMSHPEFERAMTNLALIAKLTYIAEDASADLIKSQLELRKLLTNSLPSDAISTFAEFDKARPTRHLIQQVRNIAENKKVGLSDDDAKIIHDNMIAVGPIDESGIGPFAPLPTPSQGRAQVELNKTERANRLELSLGKLKDKLSGIVSDDVLDIVSSIYQQEITVARTPLPTEEEMRQSRAKILEEVLRNRMQPPP